MKKILLFLIIFGAIIGTVRLLSDHKSLSTQPITESIDTTEKKIVEEKEPEFNLPTRLRIDKLNVDAAVESVGMDEKGRMDVPKKDENVAWYNLGYHPGENGSAVLAGHLDTRTGSPAVFYNIGKLQAGDTIEVIDENGNELTFSVTSTQSYAFDEVPLQSVFASKGKPMLNLITCEGTYDQTNQNYSRRLVVYSELQE